MHYRKLLLPALFACSGAWAQDSQREDWLKNPAMGNYKAYAEFKMAHYDAARHVWEVLAGVGNPDALFNLAILAEDGLGEPKDMAKAMALYRAAADAGSFKGQYRLGMLLSTPDGPVPIDTAKARYYLNLAAAGGDREAKARLAALDAPERPPTDFERAEMLSSSGQPDLAAAIYQKLADAGDVLAQTRLAWLYEAGRGVARNLDEAARRFQIAAEGGEAEAQYALAVMYRTGRGKGVDREASLRWLKLAAAQAYPPAVHALAAEHRNE